jgi:hypothetical protein
MVRLGAGTDDRGAGRVAGGWAAGEHDAGVDRQQPQTQQTRVDRGVDENPV